MAERKLQVNLISKPENILKTVYTACRTCYSAKLPIEVYDEAPDNEKMLTLIKRVISSGHFSTIEHIQLSFAISNVSRACTHQLVRHRHMSFSQKSQRYVKEKGEFDYIIPNSIQNNPKLKEKFENFIKETSSLYQDFINEGIPAEDARSILPNAAASSLVASLNLRELIHLANLRLCTRAQLEIRQMVKAMCDEVIKEEPCVEFNHLLIGGCGLCVGLVVVLGKLELTLDTVNCAVVRNFCDSHVDVLDTFGCCCCALGCAFLEAAGEAVVAACHVHKVVGRTGACVEVALHGLHGFLVLSCLLIDSAEVGEEFGSVGVELDGLLIYSDSLINFLLLAECLTVDDVIVGYKLLGLGDLEEFCAGSLGFRPFVLVRLAEEDHAVHCVVGGILCEDCVGAVNSLCVLLGGNEELHVAALVFLEVVGVLEVFAILLVSASPLVVGVVFLGEFTLCEC